MVLRARTLVVCLALMLGPVFANTASAAGGASDQRACTPWNHGAAARHHGWRLTMLKGAQRWAVLSFYDARVAPRANPKSDKVVVAFHAHVPVLRVVILRGDCIVDIGQMDADALESILQNDGTPV